MIVFDKLWGILQDRGISTYQLREKCGIDSKTIRRLKANDNTETKTDHYYKLAGQVCITKTVTF